MIDIKGLTLEELYELRKKLAFHVVGMTYNLQEIYKINEEIREKELKLEKGVKNGNDRE